MILPCAECGIQPELLGGRRTGMWYRCPACLWASGKEYTKSWAARRWNDDQHEYCREAER